MLRYCLDVTLRIIESVILSVVLINVGMAFPVAFGINWMTILVPFLCGMVLWDLFKAIWGE